MTPLWPVLCICGPSAAGKTTFAASLSQALQVRGRQPLQIACDDYYRQDWSPHPLFGFDTADAIDDQALRVDLSAARQGQAQTLRTYDMRTRRVKRRSITTPYDVILLEGAYGPQHLVNDFPFFFGDVSGGVRASETVASSAAGRPRSPPFPPLCDPSDVAGDAAWGAPFHPTPQTERQCCDPRSVQGA
jgi:energy-coupling factor transporter ATP-binding protein EcfA2